MTSLPKSCCGSEAHASNPWLVDGPIRWARNMRVTCGTCTAVSLAVVGDAGQRTRRFRSGAHPRTWVSANLCFTTTSVAHLHVLCRRERSTPQSFVPVRVEDSRCKRRAHRWLPPCRRSQDGSGSWRRSSPWWRPSRSMTWHEGHVLCSHLWGTKIFVNLKGL
jgi:hypothetical protein